VLCCGVLCCVVLCLLDQVFLKPYRREANLETTQC
jgi:hypothetical protein